MSPNIEQSLLESFQSTKCKIEEKKGKKKGKKYIFLNTSQDQYRFIRNDGKFILVRLYALVS